MLIPQATRKSIYTYLFNEGVLVCKKDFNNNTPNADIPSATSLQICKSMQSLESRGYVTSVFSWQCFYFTLTEEGIVYLREYLHIPESVVPATEAKAMISGRESSEKQDGEEEAKKADTADATFNPHFKGANETTVSA